MFGLGLSLLSLASALSVWPLPQPLKFGLALKGLASASFNMSGCIVYCGDVSTHVRISYTVNIDILQNLFTPPQRPGFWLTCEKNIVKVFVTVFFERIAVWKRV